MARTERKEREFNARRAEIMTEAEKIFASKGFHNATIAEIADASGFSIGALYQFFKGKEDLYIAIISEKIDLLYDEVRKAPEAKEDVLEKIETLVDSHLQFAEKNMNFLIIFTKGEKVSLSEDMQTLNQKLALRYYEHIAFIQNILRDGVAQGILSDMPPQDMAEALFYLIIASAFAWMRSPFQESLISKKQFIMNVFLHGVKKECGIETGSSLS